MRTRYFLLALLPLIIGVTWKTSAQESVFKLFKSDIQIADKHFDNGNYQTALELYMKAADERRHTSAVILNIARCHYFLKQYAEAIAAYDKYMEASHRLKAADIYYYAEAHVAMEQYDDAIKYYKMYLKDYPGDELIYQKIWRLDNIQFLYEDSTHFAVRPISINTGYGELCAVSYRSGIVFMSNRKKIGGIEQINPALNAPFYNIYYSPTATDTTRSNDTMVYSTPILFDKILNQRFHSGPVAFYQRGEKVVFASSDRESQVSRTLQLYFAEIHNGNWHITGKFPYNSTEYSITDPTINEQGNLLYFSSDMSGGAGGKDLYRSELTDGNWSKPVNLGEVVNTRYDEVFPYLHNEEVLYFSSNGHPGMGGLDIFRTKLNSDDFSEVENLGYPLNSHRDDFGITIDSLNTRGYLTSNRKEGGYDDDIYEFDMDIQTYPLEIAGVMKYIEHSWSDSSQLKILSGVNFSLIDNVRNITVSTGASDRSGNFIVTIPYYSKYRLHIIGEDIGDGIVSFEVPKYKRFNGKYEVVVVKDDFRSTGKQTEDEDKDE
ncbi:outer membrane protein OmpA family [Fulvivirga imtechensis AK7]|uniref:Outer membrane protein OmpA family n=1 Tax=Fulvivirga imtechensis AK7 TaxID=1237149 RepID=L8JT60_9BACT|nr:CDC27 family protein [Fulvivirga imtechensis]ELR72161.1 outer membrane protein OmpA family [Fulvivirga imtechensis AK7]